MKTITKISMILLIGTSLLISQEMENKSSLMKETFKEAYKKAGVDLNSGVSPTPAQRQVIKEYIESAMFPIQKKEILQEGKGTKEAKKCLEKADTLKEANSCVPSDEDKYDVWNENEKKNILKEISDFEKIIPCVEKSKNMNELQQCFPKESR